MRIPYNEEEENHGISMLPASIAEVQVSDEELLARVAKDDEQAFREFYDRYASKIYGLLQKHCHDASLCDELLQDVFISVWTKAALFRSERGLAGSWLWGIARNRLADHWRRMSSLSKNIGIDLEEMEAVPTLAIDLEIRLKDAVNSLPRTERNLVHQVYYEGHTLDSASQSSGIPLGTVKWRIQGALKTMREYFNGKAESLR